MRLTIFKITYLVLLLFPLSMYSQDQKPFVITIQPIIIQDNNGNDPASMNIPEKLINRVFEKAGIELYFLEPLYYDNIKARDGMINLDSIVKLVYKNGLIKGRGDIANMFFVDAVDGQRGPLGRGMMGGNLAFIALGDKKTAHRDALETFVITHELCHNLGLNHVVDDENVSNELPNIMGDGEFSERINPENGLTPYQIDIILNSPLVRPRIELLSSEDAKKAILDESFEPFFSKLQRVEVAAFTAQEVPFDKLKDIRNFAREKFEEAVIDFTEQESIAFKFILSEINNTLLKHGFNQFAVHPWRIIKTQNWLCGGFAYTRGNFIILSEKHTSFIADNYKPIMTADEKLKLMERIGALLVHEQMHCLQRCFPTKFENLYTKYWNFKKAFVNDHPEIIELQVSNPDAPIANWLIPGKGNEYYWIRTLFKEKKELPLMGKDFTEKVFLLEETDSEFNLKINALNSPSYVPIQAIEFFTKSFPITRGIDHPNEISAYMFADVYKALLKDEMPFENVHREAKRNTKKFKKWYSKSL